MRGTYIALACTLILVRIGGAAEIPVPEGALLPVRNAGLDSIRTVIEKLNTDLADALEAFVPVNASCVEKLDRSIPVCSNCVKSKCEARAKSVCKPEKWEEILGKTIEAIKDIPDFLVKQVPEFIIKDIPDAVADLFKDTHKFIKEKVVGEVLDATENIADAIGLIDLTKGLGDLGEKSVKELGRFGERVGKEVGRFGERVGKEAGRAVESAAKEIGRVGERIGKEIGRGWDKLWGKRSLSAAKARKFFKRSGEPGCGAFEDNASQACKVYLQPQFCPTCKFDPTSCDGYTAGINRIKDAEAARDWLLGLSNREYNLLSMKFSMDNQGQFINVKATVSLFGKTLNVNVGSVNPYLPDVAGPAVATKALEMFRNSV